MPLQSILDKTLAGAALERSELARLLEPQGDGERSAIFAAARELRRRVTGPLIFTYGFVYLSTFCRNDCRFCAYRQSNPGAIRYRKKKREVLDASRLLAEQGVNLIDLTMGEDPATDQPAYISEISDLIREVKASVNLPVMISPGVVRREALSAFQLAGADWYACYQETHNRELFVRLRQNQDYEIRWRAKIEAQKTGMLTEDGVLCGVGESNEDLADSIMAMKALGARQVRAMGFVPPAEARGDSEARWVASPAGVRAQQREVDMIAALRLAIPHSLIPASLDVEGLAGLRARLEAGANLITSLVPAGLDLAGVAQASLDINNQARSVNGVRPVVEECGLTLASVDEYCHWLKSPAEQI